MGRPLNFGPYHKGMGLTLEQYTLNALREIEKWSHDVTTRFDSAADPADDSNSILNEDGTFILKETGTGIGIDG